MEDHLGDMDFKVAGTRKGVTALQMDIKIKGVTRQIQSDALAQAREARLQILSVIESALPAPRTELSTYAPKMLTTHIDPEKIGALIAPAARTSGAAEQVRGEDRHRGRWHRLRGVPRWRWRTRSAGVHQRMNDNRRRGQNLQGKVVRVADFGAFVEILRVRWAGPHLAVDRSSCRERREAVSIGDELLVMATEIGADGKIRLSRRAVLEVGPWKKPGRMTSRSV
jgi:polyribonucleotide nucleotidyltransferase